MGRDLIRPAPQPDDPRRNSDPRPVSSLPNLGAASDATFARAGIADRGALQELGADAAYLQLIRHGTRPHFIGYYALVMALMGRPWRDCQGAEKAALRQRFDALKARALAEPGPDLGALPEPGRPGNSTDRDLPLGLARALKDLGLRDLGPRDR